MKTVLPSRRLIVFSGSEAWAVQAAQNLIDASHIEHEHLIWHQQSKINSSQDFLGQDTHVGVINAYTGLNPDDFGRISGTIIAGGAMILICPDLKTWHEYADPEKAKLVPYPDSSESVHGYYLQRWANYLNTTTDIELITQTSGHIPEKIMAKLPIKPLDTALTDDQSLAIEKIIKVVEGQRKRPAIISADRGRGKSAALGLAAALLIKRKLVQKIIITSVGFRNAEHGFKHAHATLENSDFNQQDKTISHQHGVIQYVTPDKLISAPIKCDLLLVDEAAGIGIQHLTRLLQHYSRIAFASTEHGYEGSGRGFALKFKQLLALNSRGYAQVSLSTPIRWQENDPLERWTNKLLLLQADKQADLKAQTFSLEDLSFSQLDASTLANNEPVLQNVFMLLVDAHYQTRPIDLRYLLDAPNAQLWVAKHQTSIVGLVWIMFEGGLDHAIAEDIVAGKRRPQGHLAPQIMAAHLGLQAAITLKCARVQRIVVDPQLQNKGVGQWMLKQLEQSISPNIDYLASSFGAEQSLLNFWHQAHFKTIRLSDQANAASGLYSALLIKAISKPATLLADDAQLFFSHQFIAQLANTLRSLESNLIDALVKHTPTSVCLSQAERHAAQLFAFQQRPFESTLVALNKIAQIALFNPNKLNLEQPSVHALIIICLQHQSWALCAAKTQHTGKTDCIASMRRISQQLLQNLPIH